jgi:hypothetical protein
MSEISALLPRSSLTPKDQTIFLLACHSPWLFLSQKGLVIIRSLIAAYFMFVLGMDLFFEIAIAGRGMMFVFFMGNVSLFIQLLYYCITAVSFGSSLTTRSVAYWPVISIPNLSYDYQIRRSFRRNMNTAINRYPLLIYFFQSLVLDRYTLQGAINCDFQLGLHTLGEI